MNPLLESALECARHGLRVFPAHTPVDGVCTCRHRERCTNAGKHPRIVGWKEAATTDPEQIRKWWSAWPNANIGIATGAGSGVVLLDVDPRHNGDETLAELERIHGRLPATVETLTGGGGRHLLFRHPGFSIKNKQTWSGYPGLDVRGDGGLFIAPGSLHRSGNRYEWEASSHPAEQEVAELPDWLRDLIAGPTASGTAAPWAPSSSDLPPAPAGPVLEGCGWLRHCIHDQASLGYGPWFAMLTLVARMENGEQLAHQWSREHPKYTIENTNDALRAARQGASARSCADIRANCGGEPYCRACPHWGKVKSPLALVLTREARMEPIPEGARLQVGFLEDTMPDDPDATVAPLPMETSRTVREKQPRSNGNASPLIEDPDSRRTVLTLDEAKITAKLAMAEVGTNAGAVFAPEVLRALELIEREDLQTWAVLRQRLKGNVKLSDLERGIGTLRTKHQQASSDSDSDPMAPPPDEAPGGGKSNQATELVEMALQSGAELFRTADEVCYATIPFRDDLDNVVRRETKRIASSSFRGWLSGLFWRANSKAVGGSGLRDAVSTLEGMALHSGRQANVYTRVAEHADAIYVNLADEHGRVVRVTASGWSVVTDHPIRFVRTKGMLPLPVPVAGGDIEELRPFVNVTEDGWYLLVGWALGALRPRGPYALCCLDGTQDAAKSTTERTLKRVLDPAMPLLRSEPKEERDLAIAAKNGWVIAYDNLSHVFPWLSDALCRLATGGGLATRALYTDDEEALFDFQRPVILNGIGELLTRSDLVDRAVRVQMPSLADELRRPESEITAELDEALPRILGALLNGVAAALRHLPDTHLENLPRMGDFALWVTAGETAFGWEAGTFITVYERNRKDAHGAALEASAIGTLISRFVRGQFTHEWVGTSGELLAALNEVAEESARTRKDWPKNERSLSSQLTRIVPNLRAEGVGFARLKREGFTRPIRLWVMTQTMTQNGEDGQNHDANGCAVNLFRAHHDGHDGNDANSPSWYSFAESQENEREEGVEERETKAPTSKGEFASRSSCVMGEDAAVRERVFALAHTHQFPALSLDGNPVPAGETHWKRFCERVPTSWLEKAEAALKATSADLWSYVDQALADDAEAP